MLRIDDKIKKVLVVNSDNDPPVFYDVSSEKDLYRICLDIIKKGLEEEYSYEDVDIEEAKTIINLGSGTLAYRFLQNIDTTNQNEIMILEVHSEVF
jgi:hypothetical protein